LVPAPLAAAAALILETYFSASSSTDSCSHSHPRDLEAETGCRRAHLSHAQCEQVTTTGD